MKHIYIVAEIGCNHNGSKSLAKKMVKIAKECGVDAVKFQTFKADALISKYAPKAEYQIKNTGNKESQLEMTKKLELLPEDYLELKEYAIGIGLDVFSTAFDMQSIDFLYKTGQHVWKIPSGEITNLPYLERIGSFKQPNKKIFVSTGMATIHEIKECIDILEQAGTSKEDITILHCNTEYPTPDQDVNVLAIEDLKHSFPGYKVGFSDHSVGFLAAVGASCLGISMIEKHFTLNKNMAGPDHKASATPEEMKALCLNVRRMEILAGQYKKVVTPSERKNKVIARKSIVANRPIQRGDIFSIKNLTCKRPGNGISPMEWYKILGKRAEKDFKEDELIEMTGFKWQV